MLTREQIRERLKIFQVTLGTSRSFLFAAAQAGSMVPERKRRFVVGIWINGDGTSRTVEIEKLEEDETTYTMLFDNIPVPPAAQVPIPEEWHFDIENPFLKLEGGTNLTGLSSAGSPELTILYFDDPEI